MTKFSKVALAVALGVAGLVAACMDDPLGPEPTTFPVSRVGLVQSPASIDLLARGFAIALADDDFRMQILEDMRDSPFLNHALHLSSYLSGSRGQSIMAAIGGQLGEETGAFASAIASGANMASFVNPPKFRMRWEGDADLAVLPLFEGALDEDGVVAGYRPGGTEVGVEFYEQAQFPVFLLGLSLIDFGSDPEARRASAPKHDRRTISAGEEVAGGPLTLPFASAGAVTGTTGPASVFNRCPFNDPDCEEPAPPPPPPPPPAPAPHAGYYVAGTEGCFWHFPYSPSYNNADQDGIFDWCEQNLAEALAPQLLIDYAELDATREPYFAARSAFVTGEGATLVSVFYAFSYHMDMGHPNGSLEGFHDGDSEFVVVSVKDEGDGYWSGYIITTAAHRGTPGDSSQGWWAGGDPPSCCINPFYDYPEFVPGRPLAPRVWVSRNKHGSYGSQYWCNNGGTFAGFGTQDVCSGNYSVGNVVIATDANLGNENYHPSPMRNCTSSRAPSTYPGTECFWSPAFFWGWHGTSESDTTPYLFHLRDFGF